jgi:SAM-dependent methyltransferase
MEPFSPGAVRAAYDTAADEYVVAFGDDLDRLPVDRNVLDRALAAAPATGWVLEAGCGPAPAGRYLGERAARLVGADLSEQMLCAARVRTPSLRPSLSDLRALPFRDRSCALAIAYYCLQHVRREELPVVLAELHRVLDVGGVLALAIHLGDGEVLVDEFLGHRVAAFGGTFFGRDELSDELSRSGFRIEHERRRGPLPHEHDSQRLYLIARAATGS